MYLEALSATCVSTEKLFSAQHLCRCLTRLRLQTVARIVVPLPSSSIDLSLVPFSEPGLPSGKDLGSIPLRLSFLFKSCGLWTLSCDFVPHNY